MSARSSVPEALSSAIGAALPLGILAAAIAAWRATGHGAPGDYGPYIYAGIIAAVAAHSGWRAFRRAYYGPTVREMMADLAEEVAKLPPECGWQIGQEDADHPAAGMFYADAYFPSDPISTQGGGVTPAEAMRAARGKLEGPK